MAAIVLKYKTKYKSLVLAWLRCFGYHTVLSDQKLPAQKDLSGLNVIKRFQV